jgi:hypothetical protein
VQNIKVTFRTSNGRARSGFIWFTLGTSGGLLWTFVFRKMQGLSWLAEGFLASQKWLYSMELVLCKYGSLQNISYEIQEGFFILLQGIQPYFNSGVMILIFRTCCSGQYTILTASVTE